jgi:hypothetical protein
MRPFIRESESVLPRPRVSDSEFPPEAALPSEAALPGLPTRGDLSAIQFLTWLTVGLGLLVIALAAALIVLAVVQ